MSDKSQSSDEIMCDLGETPLIINGAGKTCVFWDVKDYPIPNSVDPGSIGLKIKEACNSQGFRGDLTIRAFVDKNTLSEEELRLKDLNPEIEIILYPEEGDKLTKNSLMVTVMLLWALENPEPSNLIVLSEIVRDDRVGHRIEGLFARRFGVLLSQSQSDWDIPSGNSAYFLTSLFHQGNPSQHLDNKRKATNTLTGSEVQSQERPKYF